MKKIMFNDRYGLTEAVLSGRKTQTRRIVPRNFFTCTHDILDNNTLVFEDMYGDWHDIRKSAYALKAGEVVAVAQKYSDVAQGGYPVDSRYDAFRTANWGDGEDGALKSSAGWNNKLFVRPDLMPHHIRITDVKVERLQDISDEDCIKEGIEWDHKAQRFYVRYDSKTHSRMWFASTPRETYSALIDRISGKGTWNSNPYVFVYDFELVD